MKKSQDRPMADRSKVSSERVPENVKKAEPHGSGVARGICAKGIDMTGGGMPSMTEFMPTADSGAMEGGLQNPTGIGMGDGGPTIDLIGPDNPGKGL